MKKILTAMLCIALLATLLSATGCTSTAPNYEEQIALYDDVIAQYTGLLTAKRGGAMPATPDTKDMDEREAAIVEALYGIVNACKDAEAVKKMGYGYKDVDGDGTPELFLLTQSTVIKAIFTLSDKKPILLEACYGQGNYIMPAEGGRFFIVRGIGADQATFYTCRVDGDKMTYDAVYGRVYDQEKKECFQMVDGKRTIIDDETFQELNREHDEIYNDMSYSETSKLLVPRIYLPLTDVAADENRSVADFSSYAAILETYKAISTCLEEFDDEKWILGEYDDLFATSDDVAFDCYNRLLYTAYHRGNQYMGYDEIDLNGDGQDELVLLTEDYTIKAIFTQKDGVPVLLGSFAYDETCWLDDEGLIHVDHEEFYDLEYRLYQLDKDGDYGLVYAILLDSDGSFWSSYGYYQTKNGKTEKITSEKFKEIYEDYCRYSEPFEPNEQTRNVSELTYTPITETTDDLVNVAMGKEWSKYANLEETSGNDWGAHSITNVTFANATDGQIDVNFKHTYTFYYPDPDRDNYALDDTTESSLTLTATVKDGTLVFDGKGIKGRFEFSQEYVWLVIEESTDERFAVGFHCCEEYIPGEE